MGRAKYTIQDVQDAVRGNLSIAGVLRQLGLRPIGGNYRTINRLISEHSIDISHFTGQGWNVGLTFNPGRKMEDSEVFKTDSFMPKLSCVDR